MKYLKTQKITAIAAMAVICMALLVTGCATKRDIEAINDRISQLEMNTRQTNQLVARIDTVIAAGAEADLKLRNDIRYSSEELARQMTMLLENYNDLMTRIDQLLKAKPIIPPPPKDSPGAQTDKPAGPPPNPASDSLCTNTYDSAFTLMRGAEYEKAVTTFKTYLASCPNHENADNAMYWVGYCLYSSDKFTEAIAELKELLTKHPNSPNAGRALYHQARCNQELGKKSEARKLYDKVVKDHAGTFEAKQAAERLKEL